MNNFMVIVVGSVLVNNFVMSQFLGICPFLGVSQRTGTALGMGAAVTFVMGIASLFTWLIENHVLIPFQLLYMQTIVFILVIAVLVQVVEIILKKTSRVLYQALGVYLPLITTNCAVLGVVVINSRAGYDLLEAFVNGISAAIGFTLAIVIFAGIRERLAVNGMPKWMNGFPGALITAGLMSIAFQGFSGLIP